MGNNNPVINRAPFESRWVRSGPRATFSAPALQTILQRAFPQQRLLHVEPMHGLRNANFRLCLACPPHSIVLRIYEHDRSLCRKELDLLAMLRPSILVPEVLYAEPDGSEETPPFALLRYVEGIELRALKHNQSMFSEAAYSVGQALAHIGNITFSESGWLGPGPAVSPSLADADPIPKFVERCLQSPNLRLHMAAPLREQVLALVWSHASLLARLENRTALVQGDFGRRNIIVHQTGDTWTVAAVLDWEFAFSGSPLVDVGHFLRYERQSCPLAEPSFSDGYQSAGGKLPAGWRQFTRILDMVALCQSLCQSHLPAQVASELNEIIAATVDERDPQFA